MKIKIIEVRDEGTMIPMLCVDMNPGDAYPQNGTFGEDEFKAMLDDHSVRLWYLLRCGYPCDGRPNILMTPLHAGGDACWNDPYGWTGSGIRTRQVAHRYIIDCWEQLRDGDVVDVQHILGETKEPKKSERFRSSAPSEDSEEVKS
jgi:hypothetical protein